MSKTVYIKTTGCRLNQADTALLSALLQSANYTVVESIAPGSAPDVAVLNTCAVTGTATQKCRQALRALRKRCPNAVLVVTGCGVNAEKELYLRSCADLVLSPFERAKLPEILAQKTLEKNHAVAPEPERIFSEQTHAVFDFKTRGYLKVQDGCNVFCTYCIVPYARGRQRSRQTAEILDEFRAMLARGHREIVLTGVNTCTFASEEGGLPELMRLLLREPGDFRLRLSSAEPHACIPEIAQLMRDYPEKMCRFLHLPAQHLSPDVLTRMHRPYTLEAYSELVENVRACVPDIHIGTDLILGFPGETEADVERLKEGVRALRFANTHLFTYSPRPGTPAATYPDQVPPKIAAARRDELTHICDENAQFFRASQTGKQARVLVETIDENGMAEGWTDHYLRITFPAKADTQRGAFSTVTLD